jgi:hypothetical protein
MATGTKASDYLMKDGRRFRAAKVGYAYGVRGRVSDPICRCDFKWQAQMIANALEAAANSEAKPSGKGE